jgi:hypothetical protein
MFDHRIGGTAAAPPYRHDLIRAMSELLVAPFRETRRRWRRWCPWTLALCAVLAAWDNASTATERFRTARDLVNRHRPRRRRALGTTYQGFAKALVAHNRSLVRVMVGRLRRRMVELAGTHRTRQGFFAVAVDGTKIDAPRTEPNEAGLGTAGKAGTHPQMLLTALWHMGTGLPWAWRVGRADASERDHLRSMLPELPAGALVVADALFLGFTLLSRMDRQGLRFLVRVGANVRLLRRLGCVQEKQDTVYLWPNAAQRHHPPLVLRRIRFKTERGAEVCLVTNVLDHSALSQEDATTLYRMRWGVELFYRSLKQTLQRRKMCSASPARALVELHWTMVGLMLLGLMGVRRLIQAGHDPLALSMACALRAVRRSAAATAGRVGRFALRTALGRAVKDAYERVHAKASRCWPRKKQERPCGTPTMATATRTQRQAAKALVAPSGRS